MQDREDNGGNTPAHWAAALGSSLLLYGEYQLFLLK